MKSLNTKKEKLQMLRSFLPVILTILLIAVFLFPFPYYIEGPGTTENLKQFVTVEDKKDENSGAFYLTTVGVRRGTVLSLLKAQFSDYDEIVSKEELMGTSSNSEYERIQKYYMDSSQNTAIQQALELADIPYKMEFKGVYVLSIDEKSNFVGKISLGDTILSVDNKKFESSEEFMDYVKSQKVGQEVTITYLQDNKEKKATGKLIELSTDKKPGIGIGLTDHTEIDPSVSVKIDAGNIGGPSAGLMFTLETYSQLVNKDIRKGYDIAGTGTINSDGTVGRIGGIDKKVVTASESGADIFFAPDDEISEEVKKENPDIETNYETAKKTAEKIGTKMKIVPVKNVQDALDYMAKLKEK